MLIHEQDLGDANALAVTHEYYLRLDGVMVEGALPRIKRRAGLPLSPIAGPLAPKSTWKTNGSEIETK